MIKFFQHIRQRLLGENRFSKYLLYALGEIILVVIGILIALQINNWNEHKKQQAEEQRILKKLKIDVENDTLQLISHIQKSEKRIQLLESLMKTLSENNGTDILDFINDGINSIGYENYFRVNSGTYDESVAAASIKFIANDSLRQNIFNYYRDARINYTDNNSAQQVYRDIYPVFWRKLMATKDVMDMMQVPSKLPAIDLLGLAEDGEFMAMIMQKIGLEYNQKDEWYRFLERAKTIQSQIESELIDD